MRNKPAFIGQLFVYDRYLVSGVETGVLKGVNYISELRFDYHCKARKFGNHTL